MSESKESEIKDPTTCKEGILDRAKEIITGARNDAYGDPKDSFKKISMLWSDYLGMYVSPVDVANMMVLLKVSRQKTGKGSADNFIDIAGYAALGGELYADVYEYGVLKKCGACKRIGSCEKVPVDDDCPYWESNGEECVT